VVALERANNDSLFLQGVKDGVPISDFDHDVVGGSWNEAEILLFEKSVKPIAASIGQSDGFSYVFGIGEAGEGGSLCGGVGVEGLSGFLKDSGDRGVSQSVSDSQTGEALDFGKSAKDDDGTALFDPGNGGRRFRDKFVVGLVEDEEGTGGKFFNKGGEFCVWDPGAGGIVRGGKKYETNIVLKAGRKSGEVVMEIAVGNFLERNSKEASHQAVDSKRVSGGENAALAGLGVSVVAEFDDFVGATSEDDVVWGESVGVCDGFAEGDSRAVRIKVGMFEGVSDGLESAGGRTEGIFVRCELGDLGGLKPMFARDIGDGPTGLVGMEVGYVGVGGGKLHGFCGTELVWRLRNRSRACRIFGWWGARQAAAKRAALICPARPAAKKGPGAEFPSLRRRARVWAGVVEFGTRSGGTDRAAFLGWEDFGKG
jgi:hypothetical protein